MWISRKTIEATTHPSSPCNQQSMPRITQTHSFVVHRPCFVTREAGLVEHAYLHASLTAVNNFGEILRVGQHLSTSKY